MSQVVDIPEPEVLEAVAFAGEALGPFFLEDPGKGSAGASFEAFAALDVSAAAEEWPFGAREEVQCGLANMVGGLAGGVTDELTWEFRRLFVGPGHKAAAPWGSVYTDHDGVIFGVSALDLADWMRTHGIARLARDGEPQDHIGLLLMLMAWIARNRPELLREFCRDHFFTWSSHYLVRLERASEHPFYTGLAELTRTSLEGIERSLGLEVTHPRFFR
ncbi:MAG: molecular chaperone TorD family protein [Eggerthellaceae bacterium]|nr:molecular chaperone TorD family protein [Eggerthellaceae bacterium]